MRRIAGVLIWTLLLTSGTGCITIVREAINKDPWQNTHVDSGERPRVEKPDDQDSAPCPLGTIEHEDCRTTPCKVTCKDPRDTER